MNPYDKSISDLDDAMDRRFERIPLDPNVNILREMLTKSGMPVETLGKVIEFFTLANRRCRYGLGHALFVRIGDDQGLVRLWNYKLRYILDKQFRFEPDAFKELKDAFATIVSDSTKLH